MNRPEPRSVARRALTLIAATAVALLSACGSCKGGGGGEHAAGDVAPIPSTPNEVSTAFARAVPATSPVLVVLRDPSAMLDGYMRIRGNVAAVVGEGELGMIETDLRNTLGLDLARPASLADAGIAPNGGFAMLNIGTRAVFGVIIQDAAVFEAKLRQTLAAPPFDLRGAVEEGAVHGARTLSFRSADGAPVDTVVAFSGHTAFIFPDAAADDFAVARDAILAPQGERLADTPAFAASLLAATDYSVHAFVAGATLAANDTSEGKDAERIRMIARALGDVTVGGRITPSGIEARITNTPPEAARLRFAAVTTAAGAPGFGNLANAEVFAFVRLTLSPQELLAGARKLLLDDERAAFEQALTTIQQHVGQPIDAVLPALGANAMVLLTRARLLTLSRAMNSKSPGEFFSGLGVVIAFEAVDAPALREAARKVGEAMAERATVFEEAGATIVEFTDAQADIGNIVITDKFVVLVPARQRVEILAQLAATEADLTWIDVDAARNLVTAPTANGLYIDVRRVADGPIGQVAFARLPEEVQRLLTRTDRFTIATQAVGDTIVSDISVRLAAPAAAP